ncbi:hypothetical protein HYX58_01725 [Candidatus Dependentiae bacterium]|nr:hypothetical protein [Candidatus Dependentiae bacterium]
MKLKLLLSYLFVINVFGVTAINASYSPSEKRQKAELIASYSPGENPGSEAEPLKPDDKPYQAFSDNGVTTLIVPDPKKGKGSLDYLGLKSIINNSETFQKMAADHPTFFTPGNKLTFPSLTTDQVNDLLKLVAGDEMALTNRKYLQGKIGAQNLFSTIQTLGTAEYLDMPLLYEITIDQVVKGLEDLDLRDITEGVFSYLTPAMQKEIAKKFASTLPAYKLTQIFKSVLVEYESPLALNNAGTRLAVTGYQVTIYDIQKPDELLELGGFDTDGTQNVLFDPVNDIICFGTEYGIGLSNFITGKGTGFETLRAYPLAFDTTGTKLVLASKMDDDTPAIKILDIASKDKLAEFIGYEKPAALAPDNNLIALSSKNAVTLQYINKNNQPKKIDVSEHPTSLLFDKTGKKLAISMPSSLMILDLESGKTISQNQQASIIRFSADGQNLIFALKNNILNWQLSDNSISKIQEWPERYKIQAANEDFSVLALTSYEAYIQERISIPKQRPIRYFPLALVAIWKTNRPALETLSAKQLIVFTIAKKKGLPPLNKELINEYEKLPQEAKNLF